MSEISLRAAENLLKKAGCKRVSVEACKELQKVIEKRAVELGKMAWKLANHAKRRTVMKEDINLAADTISKE